MRNFPEFDDGLLDSGSFFQRKEREMQQSKMTYRQWLDAFRYEGFNIQNDDDIKELVMPVHQLTMGWHANGVSPETAAIFWFDKKRN